MSLCYVYTWDTDAQQWLFVDCRESEEEAKILGRILWRAGAKGVKIDALVTVVCNKRV